MSLNVVIADYHVSTRLARIIMWNGTTVTTVGKKLVAMKMKRLDYVNIVIAKITCANN
jgi:hypothetical protein